MSELKISVGQRCILAAFAVVLLAEPSSATIYNVPGDYPTIQGAIDAVKDGDEIVVAPGTYNETIDFLGKTIIVRSSGGPDVTTIDAGGAGSVVLCDSGEGPDTVLSGFTITGGSAATGGGMLNTNNSSPTVINCAFIGNTAEGDGDGGGMSNRIDSNPTVTNCTFTGNTASNGGGMYNDNSSPTVTNCTFTANSALKGQFASGGGMSNWNDSNPTVTNCTFSGNAASTAGGAMGNILGANPTVTNCTFTGNTAENGGGMFNIKGSPPVTNCTFSGNSARDGGGMYNSRNSPTVTNCTFSGNTAISGGGMYNVARGNPTVTNCTFRGNDASSGGGMVNADFTSPTVTNCTFSGNSADNDGGAMWNAQSSPTVTNCTFSGNSADDEGGGMGNFDFSNPTVTNCILWGDSPDEIFNSKSVSTVTYSNVQGGFDGEGNIDADPMFVDPDNDDLRLGSCSPSTDAGDNDAVPDGITTDLDGNPRFVDDAVVADTGNPGDAGPPIVDMGAYERQVDSPSGVINVPADFATIQAAIDAACTSAEIVVQEGTYFENINFLGKAITLRSTDPTDPAVVAATIIDAAGSGRVVHCNSGEGPDTVLSGFTITGGNAPNGAGMQNGAGSSPTVTNCTFIDNAATFTGGGMRNLNGSSPTVTNCTFSGNTASHNGGGMYNVQISNPTVTNCTFSGNVARFGNGGGMYNVLSDPTVTNCTFSGNTAAAGNNGGGMANFNGSNPTVTNCILWGDTPNEFSGAGTPIVTYSNVQGGFDGEGNIDADPMLVDADGPDDIPGNEDDDLRLLAGSPSIDAADNTAPDLAGITEDLDGNPRFVDDPETKDTGFGDPPIVDMGPYEFQPVLCPWDLDGNGSVGATDLLSLLVTWGPCADCNDCPADFDGNCTVGATDLLALLVNWGPCP